MKSQPIRALECLLSLVSANLYRTEHLVRRKSLFDLLFFVFWLHLLVFDALSPLTESTLNQLRSARAEKGAGANACRFLTLQCSDDS